MSARRRSQKARSGPAGAEMEDFFRAVDEAAEAAFAAVREMLVELNSLEIEGMEEARGLRPPTSDGDAKRERRSAELLWHIETTLQPFLTPETLASRVDEIRRDFTPFGRRH